MLVSWTVCVKVVLLSVSPQTAINEHKKNVNQKLLRFLCEYCKIVQFLQSRVNYLFTVSCYQERVQECNKTNISLSHFFVPVLNTHIDVCALHRSLLVCNRACIRLLHM